MNKTYPKPNKWWDRDLTVAKKDKKLAFRNFRRCGTPGNYDILRQKEHEFRILCRKKKESSWKSFCESLSGQSSLNNVWRMAKKFKSPRQQSDEHLQTVSDDVLTEFAKKLAPDFVMNNLVFNRVSIDEHKWLCDPFEFNELEHALSVCNNSSP